MRSTNRPATAIAFAMPFAALAILYFHMISSNVNLSETKQRGVTLCRLLLQVQRRIARAGRTELEALSVPPALQMPWPQAADRDPVDSQATQRGAGLVSNTMWLRSVP